MYRVGACQGTRGKIKPFVSFKTDSDLDLPDPLYLRFRAMAAKVLWKSGGYKAIARRLSGFSCVSSGGYNPPLDDVDYELPYIEGLP